MIESAKSTTARFQENDEQHEVFNNRITLIEKENGELKTTVKLLQEENLALKQTEVVLNIQIAELQEKNKQMCDRLDALEADRDLWKSKFETAQKESADYFARLMAAIHNYALDPAFKLNFDEDELKKRMEREEKAINQINTKVNLDEAVRDSLIGMIDGCVLGLGLSEDQLNKGIKNYTQKDNLNECSLEEIKIILAKLLDKLEKIKKNN
jgi:hypothetical protein